MSFPWLTTALLLPIVGAVVVAVLPRSGRAALPKIVSLGVSLATLVVVALVAAGFDIGGERYDGRCRSRGLALDDACSWPERPRVQRGQ